MKLRTIITLLFSTTLALSAFAQQNNSSGSAPAMNPSSTEALPPIPAPHSTDFWDGDDPSLGALIFHPFATKTYVKRHTEPIRDRLAELDQLTASNKQMIRDVDTRAQQGIKLASDKVTLADTHATDATGKAQLAQQTASALSTRVSADENAVGSLDHYKTGSQTELRFRPGQTVLSKEAKDALDQMAAPLKGQRGYILEVQGFSAGQGQAAIANSKKMADSVVRYLVLNHEIPTYRIYVIGMGNASGEKHAGTRVEVSLMKNDVDLTARK